MLNQIISSLITLSITLSVTACTTSLNDEQISNISTEISDNNIISEYNIMQTIEININNKIFTAEIYDNETAKTFISMLPVTLDMQDLNNNEKYYRFSTDITENTIYPKKICTGDIMLYNSNYLVLFYENFSTSYGYTPIGKIQDTTELKQAIGNGNIQITFNLK